MQKNKHLRGLSAYKVLFNMQIYHCDNKKRLYISTVDSGGGHGMRTPEAVTEISTFQGYGIGSDPMLSPTIPPYRDIRYSTYLISRLL